MIAGIELGGTKTVVAVGSADGTIMEEVRLPTTSPGETIATAADWITARGPVEGLGVASFGPIAVPAAHPGHGKILATPKPGWSGFDLLGSLHDHLGPLPIRLETDVNAAAVAERERGAGRGRDNLAYVTVGTGIGAGIIANGHLLHGSLHPEFGHLKVPRHPDDTFPGACPFHRDCLEGLASGPALSRRWGCEARDLPAAHPAWDQEAWYLAHGLLALLAVTSPEIVIIGGGLSQAREFHSRIGALLQSLAAGYFNNLVTNPRFVTAPELGQDAGITGALLLAGRTAT